MTVWDHLVANSTLAETAGDAWEHLTNPSGEGGGGDIIVNSEINYLFDEADDTISDGDPIIRIKEDTSIINIMESVVDLISEADNDGNITTAEEDQINEV